MAGSVVITGCNRGIGLALSRAFLKRHFKVIGGCRNPDGARDLWELEQEYPDGLSIFALDVSKESSIAEFAKHVTDLGCTTLINNAGIYLGQGDRPGNISLEAISKTFQVNCLGSIAVTDALLGTLRSKPGSRVIHITSKMGSLTDNTSGGSYAYRISKAALNMYHRSLAIDVPEIISVAMHPGWVQTDMGGGAAPTSVEESSEGIARVTVSLGPDDTGKFLDFRGNTIPW